MCLLTCYHEGPFRYTNRSSQDQVCVFEIMRNLQLMNGKPETQFQRMGIIPLQCVEFLMTALSLSCVHEAMFEKHFDAATHRLLLKLLKWQTHNRSSIFVTQLLMW